MSYDIVKPSILPGFMELLPNEQILFNKMLDIIKENFEKFGFLPIDTPVIEKSEILLAKGGGDTEKQVYRFNKGDSDLSLRFDLTVPLARYVAQNFSKLDFPFRRYQIGKVYRGERNQRGRFREFYQCDIDIVGNNSLDIINDAEIPSIIYTVFKGLGFDDFTININNRKVLNGFFDELEIEDNGEILRIIDKLDKIGRDKVKEELITVIGSLDKVNKIIEFIDIEGNNEDIIEYLRELKVENNLFLQGLEELTIVNKYIKLFGVPESNYKINLKIARGLDYYTGTVYETYLDDYISIGSICSGGRYEDLASYYTKLKLPGVGISIGFTRLFYQLMEANLIKVVDDTYLKAIFIPIGDTVEYCVEGLSQLRLNGIKTQIYLEGGKLGKRFNYADKLNIPYAIVVGAEEVENQSYTLRNMKTGEQESFNLQGLINCLI